ncbi:MAG: transporter transrane protein [Holophagaceae bacterium]|nr:transporter transrane protein [Holophagaceae bacterium]
MDTNLTYSKFRWFWLWTVTFSFTVVGIFIIAPSTIVGEMAQQLGVSVAAISAASMGTFSFVSAIGCIASGPILDKFGVPKVITVGAILTFLPTLLFPVFGGTITGVMALRIIMGLGTGPVVACVSIVALKWFPPNERPIYSGFQGTGISLGVMIGLFAVPQLMNVTGGNWKAVFVWLGIAPFIALVSCIITIFAKEPPKPVRPDNSHDFAKAVRRPEFYFTILVIFIGIWIMDAFNDLTPGYMAIPAPMGLGFGGAVAGMSMMFVSIGSIIGALLSGFIVLKAFNGRVKPCIVLGFIGCAIFTLSVRFPFIYNNSAVLYTCLFFQGFSVSLVIPQTAMYVAQAFPHSVVGKVYGTAMGIGVFGSVGITVGAYILHATGSYHGPIYVVAAISAIGAIIGLYLNIPKEKQVAAQEARVNA